MSLVSKFRFAVWFALCLCARNARADYTAVVDASSVVVTNFQGWGTSLCWWANVAGGYSNRQAYANLAFAQLKLNIVRYNIGGGENPGLTNTITNYRAIMQGFEPANGVWNWNADTNQRWMLRAAVSLGANIIDAFANSPPWWMTVSGSVTGAVDGTNNLQVAYETSFANYLATVVSNLTVLDGVHFNYITVMNEPSADWWVYDNGKQEGCHMSADQQARVIVDLAGAASSNRLTSAIDAPSDYSESYGINDLNGYTGAALNDLSLITTHTYSANNPGGLKSLAASLGHPLWVSEYGDGDATGLITAQRIHDDITQMGAQAWVYWQVVDNAGGWGFLYNPLDTNGNGGFTTNYTINEKFYVIGQFSEFIRPGFNIISVNDSNTLAAYNPAGSTLVLVDVNTNDSGYNVTYDLTSFTSVPSQALVYQTSATEQLKALPPLTLSNQQFTAAIPAASVTTFVLSNAVFTNGADAYDANLLSYRPIACWRLNEPRGIAIAEDCANGFNGAYGTDTTNGLPGIPNPPYLGISPNNLGVWMDAGGGTDGYVTTPALDITASNMTLICWVYPNGAQHNSAGIVFARGSTANGINFGNNNEFAYTWANNSATYDWTSGLAIPANQWSFLALVTTPSNAVGYVFNSQGQAGATNTVANPAQTFSTGFTIGADPQSSTLSTRIFNGEMNNVAVFNYALTAAQLRQIYSIAPTGLTLAVQHFGANVVITWPSGSIYQSASIAGPWTLVTNATSPLNVPPSARQMFYRAVIPSP